MSTNLYLAISAWGSWGERGPPVEAAIAEVLSDEGIDDDFIGRSDLEKKLFRRTTRLDGRPMLVTGSYLPVVVAGSFEKFQDRVAQALQTAVSAAAGVPVETAFDLVFADDVNGERDPLAPRIHAVTCVQSDQVEGLRGGDTKRLAPELVSTYFALPSWEQRASMIHLLCDVLIKDVPALEPVFRDVLAAPAEHSISHDSALYALSNGAVSGDHSAAFTARLVALVRKGATPVEAEKRARQDGALEGIVKTWFAERLVFEGKTAPFVWDEDAGALVLSAKSSPQLSSAIHALADAYMPCGGDLWKVLLALWFDANVSPDIAPRRLLALVEEVRIECRSLDEAKPLVDATRDLFADRGALSWFLPLALEELAARWKFFGTIDPLYGQTYDEMLWFKLEDQSEDTLSLLVGHPEPGVMDELLSGKVTLPEDIRAGFLARRDHRRRRLRGGLDSKI